MTNADKKSNIYFSSFNNNLSKKTKKSKKTKTKKKKKKTFKKVSAQKGAVKMYFEINGKPETAIQLPVSPYFELERSWNNQTVNIHGIGDVLVRGKRQLYKVSLEGFFPKYYDSAYVQVPESKLKSPQEYDQLFAKWQNDYVIRFITVGPETGINMACVIDNYKSGISAGEDINFSMDLIEYRKLKSKRATQPKKATEKSKMYTTKKGDTLAKIAKKKLGKASKWAQIFAKNKQSVSMAFARKERLYRKKKQKSKLQKFHKTDFSNRELPAKMKIKIR